MKIMKIMKLIRRTAEEICFVGKTAYKTNFTGCVWSKNLHVASYSSCFIKLYDR